MFRLVFFCMLAAIALGPGALGDSVDPADEGQSVRPAPHRGVVRAVDGGRAELTHDERNGAITLYVLDDRAVGSRPIPAGTLTARVTPAGTDAFGGPFEVDLRPVPLAGDPSGYASRFVGTDAGLVGLDRFRAALGEPIGASFSVDAAAARGSFVCPMRCNDGRTSAHGGRCPVCGMALVPLRDAHTDHSPKHGGILFMAPDGFHHLEGLLVSPDEFRLYVYNDFTQPIAAAPFADGAGVEIVSPTAGTVQLGLDAVSGGEYLMVSLPAGRQVPRDIAVRLRFAGREEPERFDFRFEAFAGSGS